MANATAGIGDGRRGGSGPLESKSGAQSEPQVAELVVAERMARYAVVATLAAGRNVLDVTDGRKSGASLLSAAGAKSVTCAAPDDTAEGSFDLVIGEAQLDEGDDRRAWLTDLARVADVSQGIVAVSVLNDSPKADGPGSLVAGSVTAILGERFEHVLTLRQHNWLASAIFDDKWFAHDDGTTALPARLHKLRGATPGEELYSVVLASNAPLPEIEPLLALTGGDQVREWRRRADEAQAEVALLRDEIDRMRVAHRERLTELAEQVAWVEENELYLKGLADRSAIARNLIRLWARARRLERRIRGLLLR